MPPSTAGAKNKKGMSNLAFAVRAVLVVMVMVMILAGEYKVLRSYTRAHRRKGGSPTRAPMLADDDGGSSRVTGGEPAAVSHKDAAADASASSSSSSSTSAASAVAKAGAGGSGEKRGDSMIKQGEWRLDPRLNKFVMMTYSKEGKEGEFKKKRGGGRSKVGVKDKEAIAHLEGEHGGEWDWCVHVGFHGLLFDWGFSRFVAFHLKPRSTLDFGCGIGLHVDYLTRYEEANMTHAVGIEPNPMSAAGIFGRKHPRARIPPIGLAMNVAEQPDDILDAVGTFDVVYTLEVMEHIPPEFHDKISSFLVKRTGKYLLFSAAQPGQHGRGHIPESSRTPDEWIAIFQKKGLYYLPQMSQKLKKAAYAIWSHRENIFAMGVSPDLDNDSPVDSRVHWNRKQVAHKVLFPLLQKGSELVAKTQNCDDFPINTDSEPYDMHQIMAN